MTDPKMDRLLIAAPEAAAAKLTAILERMQIVPQQTVYTAEAALEACSEQGALLLTTYCLPDMNGVQLAGQLGEETDVLMIIPQDFEEALPGNVLALRNPISQDALAQAIRTMAHCRVKMAELRQKTQKISRMLEERKIIDRAKGRLMDVLHMNEAQAHHHIQKKSMDSGRRIVDVAREILETESIAE